MGVPPQLGVTLPGENCPHLSSDSPRELFGTRKVKPLGTPGGCSQALTGSLPCGDHLKAELEGATTVSS